MICRASEMFNHFIYLHSNRLVQSPLAPLQDFLRYVRPALCFHFVENRTCNKILATFPKTIPSPQESRSFTVQNCFQTEMFHFARGREHTWFYATCPDRLKSTLTRFVNTQSGRLSLFVVNIESTQEPHRCQN